LKPTFIRSLATLAALSCLQGTLRAQEVQGASDSPVISRYQGSREVAQVVDNYVSVNMPLSYERRAPGGPAAQSLTVEGRREQRLYLAPAGRAGLEVHRNYQNALKAAGATLLASCDAGQPCADELETFADEYKERIFLKPANIAVPEAYGYLNVVGTKYHASYKLARGGSLIYVTLLTVVGDKGVVTEVDIVTPKAMDAGKVAVSDAHAIEQGLNAEGRMAIYGVTFDTGKADIRPDSKPQLVEMAKLLKSNPQIKVFVVGHTDNQGDFNANMALSQKRAEAISNALVKDYGIAAARVRAAGDANLAPVASNASEEGRARNRRVEMVIQ
jgi:outer membrane protein OmpA-like peptidoglycan-associated protein